MMTLSDAMFLYMNPLWYLYMGLEKLAVFAWKCYAFVMCFSWWHPTWAVTKAFKTALVWYVNIPFSIPATGAYIAIKSGFDPSTVPGVSPEVATVIMRLAG